MMQNLHSGWKVRTVLVSVLTNRNNEVECSLSKVGSGLALVLRDVDPDFRHDAHSMGIEPMGLCASRCGVEFVGTKVPAQPLGHLAAARVSSAKKEDALLLGQGFLHCWGLSAAAFRVLGTIDPFIDKSRRGAGGRANEVNMRRPQVRETTATTY